MPAVTPLPGGELIGCRFVASSLVAPDGRIEVLRSSNGGKSWDNQGPIYPVDEWCYRIPHIYDAGDGRLLLTGTRFETESSPTTFDIENGTVQRGEMFVSWSHDVGRTWDMPVPVTTSLPPDRYACNGSGALLMLPDGRWMYPFETWLPAGAVGPVRQMAAALFSTDRAASWGDMVVIADDPSGRLLHWDHCGTVLPDGRVYETMWMHDRTTGRDLPIHWTASADGCRTWSSPESTGLHGQASAPVALPNGRVAVIYTHRAEPEGVRLAIGTGKSPFEDEVVVFDAGDEALLGEPDRSDPLATNMAQGFGKMGGVLLPSGELMVTYWGTVDGVSHCRWARVRVD